MAFRSSGCITEPREHHRKAAFSLLGVIIAAVQHLQGKVADEQKTGPVFYVSQHDSVNTGYACHVRSCIFEHAQHVHIHTLFCVLIDIICLCVSQLVTVGPGFTAFISSEVIILG